MRRLIPTAVLTALIAAVLVMPAAVSAHPHGAYDKVTIGTSGNDVLKGVDGRDRMDGLAGSDKISGGKGRDLLRGGSGADTLGGGNFHDELRGGVGNDKLSGGSGNDLMFGGPGKDRLLGGPGNDILRANGDGNRDFVDCGKGTSDRAFVDARDVVTRCETVTVVGQ